MGHSQHQPFRSVEPVALERRRQRGDYRLVRALLAGLSPLFLLACSTPARHAPPLAQASPAKASPAQRANAIGVDAAFAVVSEEVSFTAGGRTIGGTLTLPKAAGAWPGLVLLAGSGPTDRDWNHPLIAGKNGSGALLATELAKHGAVVLRFDKAGSGKNPGPPREQLTIDTYRDEAVAALVLLRARPEVRRDRVFVAGHSEGAIHATRLAQVAQPPLAGVLYLSPVSRTMIDTILTQVEAQLKHPSAMLSEREVEAEMASLRKAFADFMAGKPVDPRQVSKIPWLQPLVAVVVNPATATGMRALLGFDNAAEAGALSGPFFVLAGGKDVQVDPDLDAGRLEKALRAAGRDVTLHLAVDADHVLKHEPKPLAALRDDLRAAQSSYSADGRVLDASATAAIVAWLAAHSR